MADFVNDEADESDMSKEGEVSDEEMAPSKKDKPKKKKAMQISDDEDEDEDIGKMNLLCRTFR